MEKLLAAAVLLLFSLAYIYFNSGAYKLRHIPTAGFSDPFLSYFSAIRFIFQGPTVLQEGHIKYKGGIFKIARFMRWEIIVSGKEFMADLKSAKDNCLSIGGAANEELQIPYTMGLELLHNAYHLHVIRNQLTKNLARLLPDIHEEFVLAFSEAVPRTTEWKTYRAMDLFLSMVCRTTNRGFVGLPLCRNSQYLDGCLKYTTDVLMVAQLLNLSPKFLIPFLGSYCLTKAANRIRSNSKFLGPLIEERLKQRAAKTKSSTEVDPADLLTWLMDVAPENGKTLQALSQRLMVMNFVSIHTTTLALVHTLYNLASQPSYIGPLREEIQKIISEEGWTKEGLDKMLKLDSFLKETQRMNATLILVGNRLAVADFTFSNGVTIPKGTRVSYYIEPTHRDETIYDDPDEFHGFRYVNDEEHELQQSGMAFTQSNYLSFGFGKHVCPGRFYAALELKMIFAHIILNYDMKMENEGVRPGDFIQGPVRIPSFSGKVLFRKYEAPIR